MADYEFPSDLLDAQRAYWAADARVQEVSDAPPPTLDVDPGDEELTEEQVAELDRKCEEQARELIEARRERLDALGVLNAHEWWGRQNSRHDAWMALQKAAKA